MICHGGMHHEDPNFHGTSRIYSVSLNNVDHLHQEKIKMNLSDKTIQTLMKLKAQNYLACMSEDNVDKIVLSKSSLDIINNDDLENCIKKLTDELKDCDTYNEFMMLEKFNKFN